MAMDKPVDGIKISVNQESEQKSVLSRMKNKSAPKKNIINKKQKEERKTGSLKWAVVMIFLIFIAGGLFVWQKNINDRKIEKIKEEEKKAKIDFEQRLNSLKDKIADIEKENIELKSASEQLAGAKSLLVKAKIEYHNDDLGISFVSPAILGQPEIAIAGATDRGMSFTGSFSQTEKISFGGVSSDYLPANKEATNTLSVLEIAGFAEKDKKIFLKTPSVNGLVELEIKPLKQIEVKNTKALIINKKSFISDKDRILFDIGENIAAVLNLKNKTFSSLVFLNQDFEVLPLVEFEDMIKTIEIR